MNMYRISWNTPTFKTDTVEKMAKEVAAVTEETQDLPVQEVASEVESSDTAEKEPAFKNMKLILLKINLL